MTLGAVLPAMLELTSNPKLTPTLTLTLTLTPTLTLTQVLPALLELTSNPKRDAQSVAAEVMAGLVRGAGRWPLSGQRALWDALREPLRLTLRACSVQVRGCCG